MFQIANCPAGTLSIMARPRGGEYLADEIAYLKQMGVHTLVSLVEDDEVVVCDLTEEKAIAGASGLRFIRFPIADRGVPNNKQFAEHLAGDLTTELRTGRQVVIHCRAGIGRSALIAACVLSALGVPLENAWDEISRARGVAVPDTDEQREWVERLMSPRRGEGL
jgi:protein-tyrosine phosphatase